MNTLNPSEQFYPEILRSISALISRFLVCIAPVFLIGIVQGFRYGFHSADYLFLVIGSLISGVATFFFGLVGIVEAYDRTRRLWMFPAACAGILPFLFVVYLAFVRGLWSFVGLFSHFTLDSLFASIFFTLIGFLAIRPLDKIAELCSRIGKLTKNTNT